MADTFEQILPLHHGSSPIARLENFIHFLFTDLENIRPGSERSRLACAEILAEIAALYSDLLLLVEVDRLEATGRRGVLPFYMIPERRGVLESGPVQEITKLFLRALDLQDNQPDRDLAVKQFESDVLSFCRDPIGAADESHCHEEPCILPATRYEAPPAIPARSPRRRQDGGSLYLFGPSADNASPSCRDSGMALQPPELDQLVRPQSVEALSKQGASPRASSFSALTNGRDSLSRSSQSLDVPCVFRPTSSYYSEKHSQPASGEEGSERASEEGGHGTAREFQRRMGKSMGRWCGERGGKGQGEQVAREFRKYMRGEVARVYGAMQDEGFAFGDEADAVVSFLIELQSKSADPLEWMKQMGASDTITVTELSARIDKASPRRAESLSGRDGGSGRKESRTGIFRSQVSSPHSSSTLTILQPRVYRSLTLTVLISSRPSVERAYSCI